MELTDHTPGSIINEEETIGRDRGTLVTEDIKEYEN